MFREKTGLPVSTYFSGPKIRWLLDRIPGLRERAEAGEVLFGTIDSWLIWNMCGRHVTDVTNASRTLLMNLQTLDWDPDLLDAIGVPGGDASGDPRLLGGLRRGRAHRSRGCRSPPRSATSMRRSSDKPASAPAMRSARSEPEASSC